MPDPEFPEAAALRLDPFQPLSEGDRRRLRAALARNFRLRDGEADRERGRLPLRETFFARLLPATPCPAVEPEAQRRYAHRAAPADLDPRALFAIAVGKANRGEAYGVEYELARLSRHGFAGVDRQFLHVALEERYHTRLLAEACKACGAPFELAPPPFLLRGVIRAMSWLPERVRFVLILCSESVGAVLFQILRERSAAYASRPEVAERLALLLGEVWRDELTHVAYCRARLHPALLPVARWLQPIVARALLGQVPEFAALGGGRPATLERIARPLELPEDLAWAATSGTARPARTTREERPPTAPARGPRPRPSAPPAPPAA